MEAAVLLPVLDLCFSERDSFGPVGLDHSCGEHVSVELRHDCCFVGVAL